MHVTAHPSLLYFGTPVALLSTINEDGSANLAPMSSVSWLGWRCFRGLQGNSQTTENIRRTGQLVINLPSPEQVSAVDRLACTTGSNPVPEDKVMRGYHFIKDKFPIAGLTEVPSKTVLAPRVAECPVQLDAVMEARITRVHVEQSILMEGHANRIDPDKWRPLIMSFQEFYGLGPKVRGSRLGEIPEEAYRTPDVERAIMTAT